MGWVKYVASAQWEQRGVGCALTANYADWLVTRERGKLTNQEHLFPSCTAMLARLCCCCFSSGNRAALPSARGMNSMMSYLGLLEDVVNVGPIR